MLYEHDEPVVEGDNKLCDDIEIFQDTNTFISDRGAAKGPITREHSTFLDLC